VLSRKTAISEALFMSLHNKDWFFYSYNKYLLVINVTALKRRINDGQNVEKRSRNSFAVYIMV